MSKLIFFTFICFIATGYVRVNSQEATPPGNSSLYLNFSNFNYETVKLIPKDGDSSRTFRNRIIAGVGFTPGSESGIDLSLVYLNDLRNNFFIGGGLNYNPYIGSMSLEGYYGIPDDMTSFDFLFGGGINLAVGSDNSGVILYPLVSFRFDLHLNRFNSIGFEVKAPYIGAGDQITGDIYLVGNFGFKF